MSRDSFFQEESGIKGQNGLPGSARRAEGARPSRRRIKPLERTRFGDEAFDFLDKAGNNGVDESIGGNNRAKSVRDDASAMPTGRNLVERSSLFNLHHPNPQRVRALRPVCWRLGGFNPGATGQLPRFTFVSNPFEDEIVNHSLSN